MHHHLLIPYQICLHSSWYEIYAVQILRKLVCFLLYEWSEWNLLHSFDRLNNDSVLPTRINGTLTGAQWGFVAVSTWALLVWTIVRVGTISDLHTRGESYASCAKDEVIPLILSIFDSENLISDCESNVFHYLLYTIHLFIWRSSTTLAEVRVNLKRLKSHFGNS